MPSLSSARLAGRCDCSTNSMISAFSDADISCLVLPIPVHAFFKQAVLQGEVGHDFLQGDGFSTKILHLAGGRGTGRVACQAALAGLEELLRPAVIHRSRDALAAAQLGDVLITAQALQYDADLLFRRILPARRI